MKTLDKNDLNALSKEEIIEKYIELQDECVTLQGTLAEQKILIKRYQLERFFSKRDNAYKDATEKEEKDGAGKSEDSASGSTEQKSKHTGRPSGTLNYSETDLEAVSRLNETKRLDPLDGMAEEERKKYVLVHVESTYEVEYHDATITVTKVERPVYKKIGTEKEFLCEPSHAPARNCIAGPGLLADILMMKYGFGVPHYRYVSWFSDAGFPIDTQTLYRWTSAACRSLLPLYNAYRAMISQASLVHIDETPVRTLDAEGRVNGYIFVFSALVGGRRYRLYHFSEDRKTEIVREVLGDGYRGLIVVDGYGGYDRFSDLGMGIQRCLVHAARKFKDILKGLPKAERKVHEAGRIVKLFDRVFADEEEIRQINPKTAEERLALRRDPRRKAHVDELVAALEDAKSRFAEGSCMRRAADYFLNDRESFLTFTRNGAAPVDNSEAERTVKPYALARRNFLFVRGKNGGDCSAIAMTMIENARQNGLEPLSYMKWALCDAYKGNAGNLFDSPEVPEWVRSKYEASHRKKQK